MKFESKPAANEGSLASFLVASSLIHATVIFVASTLWTRVGNYPRADFFPISLIELPAAKREAIPVEQQKAPPARKPSPAPKEPEPEEPAQPARMTVAAPPEEEAAKPTEAKPVASAPPDQIASLSSRARSEGGGSEASAGSLFGKGDVAVVPGSGTGRGGVGTATSGLGRGSGAPGLPAQTTILRTNRAAKPIQTARASYPPMALRMGVEGDVTLRIEVNTEGNVTKAEILKSAGLGFDEEALKAVKQSRFEPAQKDGQNVAAEFTYIYRFRLAK
ncbi:MAG: energy transducer TonB [Candidatus Binatia bacterium]